MPFAYRRSVNPRIVEAYRGVSIWIKVAIGVTVLAFATIGAMQTFPSQTALIVEVVAAIMLGFHVILSYPNIVKVAVVWLINVILISASSILAALTVKVTSDQGWVLTSWVVVQFLASITMTLLALTRLRGKLWLTLFGAWVVMFLTALVTLALSRNSDTALIAGVMTGFAMVFMRMVFPLRRSMRLPVEDAELLKDASEVLSSEGFHAKNSDTRHGGVFALSINKQGQIATLDAAEVTAPLSFDKHGQVHYLGKPLAGWLAQSIIEVEDSLPKGVPFIHFIVLGGDSGLGDSPRFVSLTPLNGGSTRTVCLLNGARGAKGVPEIVRELKVTPATVDEVSRLKFSSK